MDILRKMKNAQKVSKHDVIVASGGSEARELMAGHATWG